MDSILRTLCSDVDALIFSAKTAQTTSLKISNPRASNIKLNHYIGQECAFKLVLRLLKGEKVDGIIDKLYF